MEKQTILCATGQDSLNYVFTKFDELEVVDTISYKKELISSCYEKQPNILIVSDNLGGKEFLYKELIALRVLCPFTRIIYFCGKIDFTDNIKLTNLNMLIASGIFDIFEETELDVNFIRYIINNPRERSTVNYIENKYLETIYPNRGAIPIKLSFSAEEDEEEINDKVYNNLHLFVSSKHGTGKSFLIGNIAIAIASMGINKKGTKPRVALIDLDLEGFSLSDNFDTFSDDKNIFDAVREAQKIVTGNDLVNNIGLQHEVIDNIKKMLIPAKNYPDIKILCGPKRAFKEEEYCEVRYEDIVFIIENIINDYDIIIIDTNSDAEYSKIFPIFSMARNVYSVIDMSMNALRSENRLKGQITNYLSDNKIKYILNKDIELGEITSKVIEEHLEYNFIAKVPAIPANKMFNLDFKKEFLISQKDSELLKTKYEMIKVANDIWPIKNMETLRNKMDALFNNVELEEKEYSNKFIGKVMKGLGFDSDDGDVIKSTVKNSKIIDKAKDFTFKDILNKFKRGAKEISSDIEKEKQLKGEEPKAIEEKISENIEGNIEGGEN